MSHDVEESLEMIISESQKSKDFLLALNKMHRTINFCIKKNQSNSFTNPDLNLNRANSLLFIKSRIKEVKKNLCTITDNTPKIEWFDSQEKFLELFCKLIKNKTILIPNQRDRNNTINLISNIFLVKMVRGEGFYSPVSLAKYMRERISEYI
jgi:hypothetical protein